MTSSRSGSQLPMPTIGDKAYQPSHLCFPRHEFGKTSVVKRSFQPQWFGRWPWLHYDEDRDLAFCLVCVVAYNSHLHSIPCLEQTFISTGFSNWKDVIAKFTKHESSQCHKESVLKTVTLPATYIKKILLNILFMYTIITHNLTMLLFINKHQY